ncbi:MAG: hypothetical protein NVSMB2_24320 [Chloroflexota bacterium]
MTSWLRLGLSLRTRLTLWYGALLALTLLAFSALLYFTLQQSLASSMDSRLAVRADGIRREVGPSIGNLLQPEDVAPTNLESTLSEFTEPGIYVQLLNSKGAVVAAPPNLVGGELPVPPSSRQSIADGQRLFVTIPVASGEAQVRLLSEPIYAAGTNDVIGAVQVAESLSPFENTMSAVARLLLTAGLLALLLAVAVGWSITRTALSPLARITETARHIAATGDYRQRLHVTRPRSARGDELYSLAATFNDMIARLEHMLESQRRLLADTSHELRNPITIIRGNLALLRREDAAIPDATRREAILEAEDEAARMGRLVGDLLFLARADAGESPSLQREEVDLSDLVAEVVERVRPQARAHDVRLTADPLCIVNGDRDRLRQLLANLLENAIRYTPPGGDIDISVRRQGARESVQHRRGFARSRSAREVHEDFEMVEVTVRDSGIGIAASDLPHLFERFYRADKARSRAQGGSGLGLSIAEYIVHAHGGTISASSDGPDRGSTFSVCLPIFFRAQPGKRIALSAAGRRTALSR